jgi:hypothetical protein
MGHEGVHTACFAARRVSLAFLAPSLPHPNPHAKDAPCPLSPPSCSFFPLQHFLKPPKAMRIWGGGLLLAACALLGAVGGEPLFESMASWRAAHPGVFEAMLDLGDGLPHPAFPHQAAVERWAAMHAPVAGGTEGAEEVPHTGSQEETRPPAQNASRGHTSNWAVLVGGEGVERGRGWP